MKRVVAVIGAVVMIVVSLAIRGAIDDKGSSASGGGRPVTIACVTELADACNSLTNVTVRVEDAARTAQDIASGAETIDGWITFDPWPAMVNALAGTAVTHDDKRVAQSDLAIAMVAERAAALAPKCGGQVNWKCLGDAIGSQWSDVGGQPQWGQVKAGLPSPKTASGVLLLGNAASGFFGTSTFATNDFNDDFRVWNTKITSTPATFNEFIQFFPAKFSAVGVVRALADPGVRASEVEFVAPSPAATAVVVLSDLTGRAGHVAADVQRSLTAAGWSPPAAAANGLPDPGVLLALAGLTE